MSRIFHRKSKQIELKREYTKNILKTVSAFSNYHDGEIMIGVDDHFKIVGITDPVSLKH